MSIFFYIAGYIVLMIAISLYLKYRKDKAKEISGYSKAKQVANNIFDRKKHNDYMNNPKFSYMSCNRYNPNSSFYKERVARREKRYVLVEESEYNNHKNSNTSFVHFPHKSSASRISDAQAGIKNEFSTMFDPLYNPLYKH